MTLSYKVVFWLESSLNKIKDGIQQPKVIVTKLEYNTVYNMISLSNLVRDYCEIGEKGIKVLRRKSSGGVMNVCVTNNITKK